MDSKNYPFWEIAKVAGRYWYLAIPVLLANGLNIKLFWASLVLFSLETIGKYAKDKKVRISWGNFLFFPTFAAIVAWQNVSIECGIFAFFYGTHVFSEFVIDKISPKILNKLGFVLFTPYFVMFLVLFGEVMRIFDAR